MDKPDEMLIKMSGNCDSKTSKRKRFTLVRDGIIRITIKVRWFPTSYEFFNIKIRILRQVFDEFSRFSNTFFLVWMLKVGETFFFFQLFIYFPFLSHNQFFSRFAFISQFPLSAISRSFGGFFSHFKFLNAAFCISFPRCGRLLQAFLLIVARTARHLYWHWRRPMILYNSIPYFVS